MLNDIFILIINNNTEVGSYTFFTVLYKNLNHIILLQNIHYNSKKNIFN